MLLLMYPLMTYAKAQNFNIISTLLTTDRYTMDPKTPINLARACDTHGMQN
jgi:hypothetical protein